MSLLLSILLGLALAGVLIYIIAENQHPTQTLAWVVVIIFLPVVGLILYFLVGHRPVQKQQLPPEEKHLLQQNVSGTQSSYHFKTSELYQKVDTLQQHLEQGVPLAGNANRIYNRFYAMLADLMTDMEQARDHIHFEFFKFEDDAVGRQVAELLKRKVREGVEVRVQYDDLANLFRKKFFRELKEAGVRVKPFLAVNFPFISPDSNFRNHRKIVVIDGRVGYLGGMNIAERYGEGLDWGPWRDTHMRIEGPAVSQLQVAFVSDWRFSSHELLSDLRYFPAAEAVGETPVQVVASSPMSPWHAAMQGLIQLLGDVNDYIYLQTPYFIPTSTMMLALKNAALAGVDVRVMFPERSDGLLTGLASKSYVKEALSAGVRIFLYQGGFLHSKTIVCDDDFASVGSTNLDVRSFTLDFEIDAYCYDPAVASQQKAFFLEDMEKCIEVTNEFWASRSRWEKFKESLARLFSPLL
jgi:cardiolipin synthase